MHLQMQCDVWLDNIINSAQYILRYTVANSMSLSNIAFRWLTSEYMQLASGLCSWQPLDYRCKKELYEGKMLILH